MHYWLNMKNTIRSIGNLWENIAMWWDDMGGVVAHRSEDCKPNNRPMFIAGFLVVAFNIGWGIFAVSHFLAN